MRAGVGGCRNLRSPPKRLLCPLRTQELTVIISSGGSSAHRQQGMPQNWSSSESRGSLPDHLMRRTRSRPFPSRSSMPARKWALNAEIKGCTQHAPISCFVFEGVVLIPAWTGGQPPWRWPVCRPGWRPQATGFAGTAWRRAGGMPRVGSSISCICTAHQPGSTGCDDRRRRRRPPRTLWAPSRGSPPQRHCEPPAAPLPWPSLAMPCGRCAA